MQRRAGSLTRAIYIRARVCVCVCTTLISISRDTCAVFFFLRIRALRELYILKSQLDTRGVQKKGGTRRAARDEVIWLSRARGKLSFRFFFFLFFFLSFSLFSLARN